MGNIVEPSIIEIRKLQQSKRSIWQFVISINKKLEIGQIISDSIWVAFNFPILEHKIKEIVEIYENVGWEVTYVTDKTTYVNFNFSLKEN